MKVIQYSMSKQHSLGAEFSSPYLDSDNIFQALWVSIETEKYENLSSCAYWLQRQRILKPSVIKFPFILIRKSPYNWSLTGERAHSCTDRKLGAIVWYSTQRYFGVNYHLDLVL
jgi:hypothetical protein